MSRQLDFWIANILSVPPTMTPPVSPKKFKRARLSRIPGPPPPPRVGLINLPNELLFMIMWLLDTESLFALLRSSRRVHLLAFPIFLVSVGIREDTRWTIDSSSNSKFSYTFQDSKSYMALKALSITPMITEAEILSCFFGEDSLPQIADLARLISRLSHFDALLVNIAPLQRAAMVTEEVKARSIQPIWDLLTSLSGASCVALALAEMPGKPFMPRLFGNTSSAPPPEIRPLMNLTKVVFAMPILFTPLFRSWTIQLINTSPITDLSLECAHLPKTTWAEILPLVTLPALNSLSVQLKHLRFTHLSAFLLRHPSITSLSVRDAPITSRCLPDGALPILRELCGTALFVSALLQQPNAFPILHAVNVLPRQAHDSRYIKYVTSCLHGLAARSSPTPIRLILAIGAPEKFMTPTQVTRDWADYYYDTFTAVGIRVHQVEHLTIDLRDGPDLGPQLPVDLRVWLSCFPSTINLVLICRERGHKAWFRLIWPICPHLRTVEVARHMWGRTEIFNRE